MNIIINHSSMVPIYEQLMEQIKTSIIHGELTEGDALPSVRSLSGKLKISALTVKKAYDALEEGGYTATVHGKGTYVTSPNQELIAEERRKRLEAELEAAIQRGRSWEISDGEILTLVKLILDM